MQEGRYLLTTYLLGAIGWFNTGDPDTYLLTSGGRGEQRSGRGDGGRGAPAGERVPEGKVLTLTLSLAHRDPDPNPEQASMNLKGELSGKRLLQAMRAIPIPS